MFGERFSCCYNSHANPSWKPYGTQCCFFPRPLFEVNKLHRKMNGRRQSYPSTIHPPLWIGFRPHQVMHIPPIHDQTPPLFLLPTNGPWTRLLQHFRPRVYAKNPTGLQYHILSCVENRKHLETTKFGVPCLFQGVSVVW